MAGYKGGSERSHASISPRRLDPPRKRASACGNPAASEQFFQRQMDSSPSPRLYFRCAGFDTQRFEFIGEAGHAMIISTKPAFLRITYLGFIPVTVTNCAFSFKRENAICDRGHYIWDSEDCLESVELFVIGFGQQGPWIMTMFSLLFFRVLLVKLSEPVINEVVN
jgi:hypothetical protein